MTFIHRSRHHVPHGKLLGKSTPALLGVWVVTVASFTHIRPGIFFIILIIRNLHFSLIILWFWWYLLVRSSTSFSFQGPWGVSVITTQGQKVSISNKKVSNLDLHPNSGNQESQQTSAFFCRSSLAKRWSQPKRSRVSGQLKWTTQVPFSCGPSLHLFTTLELFNLCVGDICNSQTCCFENEEKTTRGPLQCWISLIFIRLPKPAIRGKMAHNSAFICSHFWTEEDTRASLSAMSMASKSQATTLSWNCCD